MKHLKFRENGSAWTNSKVHGAPKQMIAVHLDTKFSYIISQSVPLP
jgi:hypothetical protein